MGMRSVTERRVVDDDNKYLFEEIIQRYEMEWELVGRIITIL